MKTTKQKIAATCPQDVAEYISGIVARAHKETHNNKFSFGLRELKARYADTLSADGKLPNAYVWNLQEALASFASKQITAYHDGAHHIVRQGERGRIYGKGISGDNGAEVVAIRTTATAHTRNENEQSELAARELNRLREQLIALCVRTDGGEFPSLADERAELVARARKMISRGEAWRKFCLKERKLQAKANTSLRAALDKTIAKEKEAVAKAKAAEKAKAKRERARATAKRKGKAQPKDGGSTVTKATVDKETAKATVSKVLGQS